VKRNFLIFGGSGFVGTHLSSYLESIGERFLIADLLEPIKKNLPFKITDVRERISLDTESYSDTIIVNLAAVHKTPGHASKEYFETNIKGAENVCDFARDKNINTIVFTSSVAIYGFAPLGTDESGEINYFNDYGRTKYEAELVYKAWYEKDPENRKLVIVRPTVVFGEQNRGNVYNLLRQIASGKFMMIGDGENRKSMAYVENVAAFLEYSLGFENGLHIYNYIDKPDFDMNTLVKNVNKACTTRA